MDQENSKSVNSEDWFNSAFGEYYPKIYLFAFNYFLNEEDSVDAVQETFMRLYQNKERIDLENNILPWLYTVVRNICLDSLRKKGRKIHPRLERSSPEESEIAQIKETIYKMDEPYRSILIYKFCADLDNNECSRLLRIKLEHFGVYLSRALEKLRKMISQGEQYELP